MPRSTSLLQWEPRADADTHPVSDNRRRLMVEYLRLDRSDGVATITIDRPEVRNAITAPGWTGLHDLFDEVAGRLGPGARHHRRRGGLLLWC